MPQIRGIGEREAADQNSGASRELAHVFEERGLPGDALRLYRKIWQRWPGASPSEGAHERGSYLERATGAPPAAVPALRKYASPSVAPESTCR